MRDLTRLRDMIRKHEGLSLKPYKCPTGHLTIGFGRNIEAVGISKAEAEYLLKNDIDRCIQFLEKYEWFNRMTEARQDVVINMVFNLGEFTFLQFKKFLAALHYNDYDVAAKEMLNSRWSGQVGKRAKELADIMKAGVYP